MIAVFAQFDRSMISERTRLECGMLLLLPRPLAGRPPSTRSKKKHLIEMIKSGQKAQAEMAWLLKVKRSVIGRMSFKERVDRCRQRSERPER